MTSISAIVAFVSEHRHLAYLVVFAAAAGEAVPVIGTIVPGTVIIIAIAALIPGGSLDFWPVLMATILGAIVGDGLSYWLGHRYKQHVLAWGPLRRKPGFVEAGKAFFYRHGGKSIFFARFLPGVRAVVPVVAGITGMPARIFYAINIISAVAWGFTHVLTGMIVGSAAGLASAVAGRLTAVILIVALFGWLAFKLLRFAFDDGLRRLEKALLRLLAWARGQETWYGRLLVSILDPAKAALPGLAVSAVVLIAASWVFLGILEDVISGDPLVRTDMAVYNFLQEFRNQWTDRFFIVITELGDTVVTTAMTISVAIWLLVHRARRLAGFWIGVVAVASALNTIIKVALRAARPVGGLYSGWSTFSFPSGHATVNAALYGFLAFLLARDVRPVWRGPIIAAAASFIILIACSRLYLGAHWFSDVAAGLAFGSIWIAIATIAVTRHPRERVAPGGLLMTVLATLVLVGGFHIAWQFNKDDVRYASSPQQAIVVDINSWLTDSWRMLPARRVDLAGDIKEPLTLQYAGDLADFQNEVRNAGWRLPQPWSLLAALAWTRKDMDASHLPVLPKLHEGRAPELTLIRSDSHMNYVLRLWPTSVFVSIPDPAKIPLWIGEVRGQKTDHPLGVVTRVTETAGANGPRDVLGGLLPNSKLVKRDDPAADPNWDGRVLLITIPKS